MKCVKCSIEIHPLRVKALPSTKVCVDCSTAGAYRAVNTTHGSGDHTWNDIKIMTPEEFTKYSESDKEIYSDEETYNITFGVEDTNK
tara:strand:- start:170 stop:430 length:261 start_codon:yes stop_codon:yes gene_type:complete